MDILFLWQDAAYKNSRLRATIAIFLPVGGVFRAVLIALAISLN